MLFEDAVVKTGSQTNYNSEELKEQKEESGIELKHLEDMNNVYIKEILNLCKEHSSIINTFIDTKRNNTVTGKVVGTQMKITCKEIDELLELLPEILKTEIDVIRYNINYTNELLSQNSNALVEFIRADEDKVGQYKHQFILSNVFNEFVKKLDNNTLKLGDACTVIRMTRNIEIDHKVINVLRQKIQQKDRKHFTQEYIQILDLQKIHEFEIISEKGYNFDQLEGEVHGLALEKKIRHFFDGVSEDIESGVGALVYDYFNKPLIHTSWPIKWTNEHKNFFVRELNKTKGKIKDIDNCVKKTSRKLLKFDVYIKE